MCILLNHSIRTYSVLLSLNFFFLKLPMKSEIESAASNAHGIAITLQVPQTSSNFMGFNKACKDLDDCFLMQPVNEAEYDSETQVCVDRKTNGPVSYYDHFVSRPVKKKGANAGSEVPMCRVAEMETLAPPREKDLPLASVEGTVLRDPVARRLATGCFPPHPSEEAASQ